MWGKFDNIRKISMPVSHLKERLAKMERTEPVLLELSKQALKVDPEHPSWVRIHRAFRHAGPLREPLLHWTRLAEPVMRHGRVNAERWELVS